jgi:ppGpp synthetase/RelA/SpoT-type nucleotidyltranferase/calcineurin-like phosphoesterase family protein
MIKILHVSDVHFGVNDPRGEQALITDALINAVERDGLDPNVIIFSGDLAFSGTPEQFKMGENWLRRLCDAAPHAELFVVPGNHDVQRTKVRSPNLLHAFGSKEVSFNEWKQSIRDHSLEHLDQFFAWHKAASAVLPLKGNWTTPFGFHYIKEGLERPLHIVGLNSALLSCSDSDDKNLAIDVLAATDGLRQSQGKPGVIVAVAHHPLESLVHWNKAEIEKFLSQGTGADIYLHGHLHAQLGVSKSDITGKSLATLAAGATYQGSNWPQQFASYEIGERDLQTVAYTYSANSGEWVPDNRLSHRLLLDLPPLLPTSVAARALSESRDRIQTERARVEAQIVEIRRSEKGSDQSATIGLTHVFIAIDHDISRHRIAARYVETEVARYFRDDPMFAKVCYAVKHRVKHRDRIKEKMHQKGIRDAHKIVDICGFRLITLFQSDIPLVVDHILKVVEFEDHPISPFTKGCSVEIDVNTSRTESDPLSISGAVQEVAARSALKPKVVVRSRPTGYSSVHIVVLAPAREIDSDIKEMFLEIQIRSAWEDIWGEIDHHLRYGSERGGPGVSSSQHLNVFKALIDGVVQYVDVIRLQSKDDTPKSPSAIKVDRTIATPVDQLRLLQGLRPEILDRVDKAFDLWKQADASRQRGGDPGLLRQAADAFSSILEEFKGQPVDNPKLADELEYVAATERAYLLMYTGDDYDLAQSAELYKNILAKTPKDATALFRLGIVKSRQKQHRESDRLLSDALAVIESGRDDRLGVGHWTYDIARLHLGLTRWRIFKDSGQREWLTSAITLARSVIAKLVDPTNLLRAVNDLIYYAYEERQISDQKEELLVDDVEFQQLTEKLEQELAVQERSYEYQDTLMSALIESGRNEEARLVALKLRDMLEQVAILKSPGTNLGKKGTYAWMAALSKVLNDQDQQECLVHAQDVIASH